MKRKLLALFLALVMVLGMLPVQAFAQDVEPTTADAVTELVDEPDADADKPDADADKPDADADEPDAKEPDEGAAPVTDILEDSEQPSTVAAAAAKYYTVEQYDAEGNGTMLIAPTEATWTGSNYSGATAFYQALLGSDNVTVSNDAVTGIQINGTWLNDEGTSQWYIATNYEKKVYRDLGYFYFSDADVYRFIYVTNGNFSNAGMTTDGLDWDNAAYMKVEKGDLIKTLSEYNGVTLGTNRQAAYDAAIATILDIHATESDVATAKTNMENAEDSAGSITLNKESTELYQGQKETLTATLEPEGSTDVLTWTSSDEDIVVVADGVIKGMSAGTATVTVEASGLGLSDTIEVTVNALQGLIITKLNSNASAEIEAEVGELLLAAFAEPDNLENLDWQWSVEDPSIAKVIPTEGNEYLAAVRGLKEGTTNVVVALGSMTATFEVKVTAYTGPYIYFDYDDDREHQYLDENDTITLTALDTGKFVLANGNGAVNWSGGALNVPSTAGGNDLAYWVFVNRETGVWSPYDARTLDMTVDSGGWTKNFKVKCVPSGITELKTYVGEQEVTTENPYVSEGKVSGIPVTVKGKFADGEWITIPSAALHYTTSDTTYNFRWLGNQLVLNAGGQATMSVFMRDDWSVKQQFIAKCNYVALQDFEIVTPEEFTIDTSESGRDFMTGEYYGLQLYTDNLKITYTPSNATNTELEWEALTPGIAIFRADHNSGIVPRSCGTAKFKVTSKDNPRLTKEVVVTFLWPKPLESATLEKTKYELDVGEEEALNIVVSPADATEKGFTYSYSADGIVEIRDGKIIAKHEGVVTVTATPLDTTRGCQPITFEVRVGDVISTDVSITVNNKGGLAKAADGTVMVERPVTVEDNNGDGILTYDEALVAAHAAYCPNGYAIENGWVTKLWGEETYNSLFIKNGVPLSDVVNNTSTSTVASEDELYISINADNSYYSDFYTSFNPAALTVQAGKEFTLNLSGYQGMVGGTPAPVAGVSVGTLENGEFAPIDGKQTDADGNVTLSLSEIGTYYITAQGTVTTTVYDWYTGENVEVEAPIMAPYCVVTVTDVAVEMASNLDKVVGGKTLTMKVLDSNTGKALKSGEVRWSLKNQGDEAYATISASGSLKTYPVAQKCSVTLVCELLGSRSGSIEHTVTIYPAVTQVEIWSEAQNVTGETLYLSSSAGATLNLTARLFPTDAKAGISWKSSNTKIATVSGGTVTATGQKTGTVTITATAQDGSGQKATVKIQLGNLVTEVNIVEPASTKLTSGSSMTLKATTIPEKPTVSGVTFSLVDSADAAYVTLSSSGEVKAKTVYEPHEVAIKATSKDAAKVSSKPITLTILPKGEEILILKVGDKNVTGTTLIRNAENFRLSAYTLTTADGETMPKRDVTWSTSNKKCATVDGNGLVTCVKAGTAQITATADDGKQAVVTVKFTTLVSKIEIATKSTEDDFEIASGKSVALKANVEPANASSKKVTWSIIDGAEYAKISSSGVLKANSGLTRTVYVTVCATAQDGSGVSGYRVIRINPLAQGVRILKDSQELTNTKLVWDMVENSELKLSAKVYPAAAEDTVTWKSSSTKIASVEDGKITCHKAGTVTITATANDGSGKKASFKLTVVKQMKELKLEDGVVAGGKSLNVKYVIGPDDTTNKKLTWTISENAVGAKISSSGKLTTKKVTEPTAVTITAAAQDGSGLIASCDVTIYPATTKVVITGENGAAVPEMLAAGAELKLAAASTPANAANVYAWKSSNQYVTVVDGTVVASEGAVGKTVTITCVAADGTNKSASVKIKIVAATEG